MHSYGILQRQDITLWNTIDWLIHDGSIIESYRARLFVGVQHSLRPNIATRIVEITMFMHVNVFVDTFQDYPIKVCKTMFTFREKGCEQILKFLDYGWDKIMSNTMYCEVVHNTMSLKYIFLPHRILYFHFSTSIAK